MMMAGPRLGLGDMMLQHGGQHTMNSNAFDGPMLRPDMGVPFGQVQRVQQQQPNQFQGAVEQMPVQQTGYNNAALQAPRMRLADLVGMYRNAGL